MRARSSVIVVVSCTSLVLGFLMAPALAKRVAPKAVPAVVSDGIAYQAISERYIEKGKPAGLRVLIEAKDTKTQKSLWRVKVYEIAYKPDLETDVQDVYIKSMSLGPQGLLVTNERGRSFLVDLKKRTVREVEAAEKQGSGS